MPLDVDINGVRFGGGAVPGFFFKPRTLALIFLLLTRISHVGGNSIGTGALVNEFGA
jgi:hypothetical protein